MIGFVSAMSRVSGERGADRARGWSARVMVLALAASMALSGCGTTGTAVVARVQGSAISGDTLAHWTKITRAELQGSATAASTMSSAEIKRKALAFLITADWVEMEAHARGISVSRSEVDATYQRLLNGPTGKAFASGLKRRGMSSADERLKLRLAQLTVALHNKIVASQKSASAVAIAAYYHTHASQFRRQGQTLAAATSAIRETLLQEGRRQAFAAFVAAYSQRWKERTTCEPGYVIAECRNGPPLPAAQSGRP